MILEPVNKLLVIEKLQIERKKSEVDGFKFVVPDSPDTSRYCIAKLVRAESGSKFADLQGHFILVQSGLIDQVEFQEYKYSTITENGVVGILRENEL
jgi:hypothetical protein